MPTRQQLVAAINTLRGRTPLNPVKDTELADMLQSWLDYYDDNGLIVPQTFQAQLTSILSTYNAHIATFQGNITSAQAAVISVEAQKTAIQALQVMVQADRVAAEAARNQAEIFKNQSESAAVLARNYQDSWNPITATPNLLTLSLNNTTDKGKFWKVDVPGAANPVATTNLGGVSRQVGNGDEFTWNGTKWVYNSYSDLALQKAKKLEEEMLLAKPVTGVRVASVGNQGVVDPVAGTITQPVGGNASNSHIMERTNVADQPDWTTGTKLRFIFQITESYARAFDDGGKWVPQIQLLVQRATLADAQGTNISWTRKSDNEIWMFMDYTITADDTRLDPFFRVQTNVNNTGQPIVFTWKIMQVRILKSAQSLSDLSENFLALDKRIQKNLKKLVDLENADFGALATITHGNVAEGGGSAANAGSATSVYYNDPNGKVNFDGLLKEFAIWIATAGTFYISIGTPVAGIKFVPRKILGPFNGVVGLNTFNPAEKVREGEYIAIGGGDSTAIPKYTGGGAPAGNKFVSHSLVSDASAPAGAGSYIAFYFKVEGYPDASKLLRAFPKKGDVILKDDFSQDLSREISKNITSVTYTVGATGPGDATDPGGSSADEVKYSNGASKFKSGGILEKIEGYFGVSGIAYFSIGAIANSKFVPRVVLGPFQAEVGFNTFPVSVPVFTDEIFGLGGENGGTAKIRFGQSGGVAGVTYYQKHTYGPGFSGGGSGSYYALSGVVRTYPDRGFYHDLTTRRQLGLSLGRIISHGITAENPITFGTATDHTAEFVSTGEAFYTDGYVFPANGKISKISVNIGSAAIVNFAIGLIDQWGKVIVERTFNRYGLVGVNDFVVNELVKMGQVLLIKTPSATIRYKTGVAGKTLYKSAGYTAELVSTANAHLSLVCEFREVINVDIAKKSDLDVIKGDVENLKAGKGAIIRTVPSGYLRELISDDNGSNIRSRSIYPERILCLGNSITASVPLPNIWWGTWGMAASQKSKDWVRVLEARLKLLNPACTAVAKSISNFEVNHTTWDLTAFDAYFDTNPDLVIIRAGENSNDNIPSLGASYERLIDYIRSKVPNAKIVATGSFWTSAEKELQMTVAFKNKGVKYVKIDDFFNSGHISFVGAVVKGDDGLDHVINSGGVAMHPNDAGMAKIADRIYNALV